MAKQGQLICILIPNYDKQRLKALKMRGQARVNDHRALGKEEAGKAPLLGLHHLILDRGQNYHILTTP